MKRLIQIIAIIAMMAGFSFTALPANASGGTSATTTVTATPDVLTANASFVGTSKKVEACKAYAEKLEQHAPPRDPQALCKGKLTVLIVGKVKTPECPPGWFGGSASMRVKFKEVLKARAFAKSIASGRVRTWARTKIVDRVKVTGEAQSNCVPVPVITTPVYDHCPNLPGDQPSGYICSPPVHDECPNIPGDQPAGYECTPPVYDHCPNLPGDQPSGYICYPPVYDECPDIPGNQPKGYDCSPPVKPVIVDKTRVNDLRPGARTDICATADFDKGHMGTLFFSFESGAITGTNPVQVSDLQQGCATLVAPTETGWYTYKVTATDSVNGLSVTETSAPFEVWVSPPPNVVAS